MKNSSMWEECILPDSKTPQLAEAQGIIALALSTRKKEFRSEYNNCLGVVHMEEGVQIRVQVEVGREEQGEGETQGKGQSEETDATRSTAHHGWYEYEVTRACRHLSHVV